MSTSHRTGKEKHAHREVSPKKERSQREVEHNDPKRPAAKTQEKSQPHSRPKEEKRDKPPSRVHRKVCSKCGKPKPLA